MNGVFLCLIRCRTFVVIRTLILIDVVKPQVRVDDRTDSVLSGIECGFILLSLVCLTLAKWETVPGQFGGYLSDLQALDT